MPKNIFEIDYVYDIVLSDFGRKSTINLLTYLADEERARIQHYLSEYGGSREAPFFDEYRRIMFTCIGDLRTLKKGIIPEKRIGTERLEGKSILYGVNGMKPSSETINQIAEIVIDEVLMASKRDYRKFRLVIPCNTLAIIENELHEALENYIDKLKKKALKKNNTIPTTLDIEVLQITINGNGETKSSNGATELRIFTVPKTVIKYIKERYKKAKLLVIGTELAQEEYAELLSNHDMTKSFQLIKITEKQQKITDELLVASIGENAGYVREMKQKFEKAVLSANHPYDDPPLIIEASTDFDLEIGINTLNMFARALLNDAYKDLNDFSELSEFDDSGIDM